MKQITVLQNSAEWLDLRDTRLGASDANIVMGLSNFCTPIELLKKKALGNVHNEDKKDNSFITDRGHRLEEKTRAIIELETGLDFPAIVALSSSYDFLMASLDGYNEETNKVLECKYVGASDFEIVKSGKCLDHYYPQLQQQMIVTGAKENILSVCKIIGKDESNLEYASIVVKFDEDYCMNKLIPAMTSFWGEVEKYKKDQNYVPNLELTKSDVCNMDDDEIMIKLTNEYLTAKKNVEVYTERLNILKKEIFKNINHSNVLCGNVHIQKINVKGRTTIDFKKFVSDNDYTIPDTYIKTGRPTVTQKITIKKERLDGK